MATALMNKGVIHIEKKNVLLPYNIIQYTICQK